MVDPRSVKITGVGGEHGYGGDKKVKRRKYHLLVDTQGLILRARKYALQELDFEILLHKWVVERTFS
jgi:hypothetical protein